jgi:spore coat polysaccharide biosynthesis protein SpsF
MSRVNETVFLTVRTNSTRLPEKCFLPFGETNVLGHVIKRAKFAGFEPIVCTSKNKSDDKIDLFCKELGVPIYRGSLDNKILRWYECARSFKVEIFHTIDVDDPFFDSKLIIQSMELLVTENLDVVYPTELSSNGSASVGYSIRLSALEKEIKYIESIKEFEMVDSVFDQLKSLKRKILTTSLLDIPSTRLTLDYPEDYWLLLFVLRELGPNCSRENLAALFSRNPDLFKFNWYRNKEWAANQNHLRSEFEKQNV